MNYIVIESIYYHYIYAYIHCTINAMLYYHFHDSCGLQ